MLPKVLSCPFPMIWVKSTKLYSTLRWNLEPSWPYCNPQEDCCSEVWWVPALCSCSSCFMIVSLLAARGWRRRSPTEYPSGKPIPCEVDSFWTNWCTTSNSSTACYHPAIQLLALIGWLILHIWSITLIKGELNSDRCQGSKYLRMCLAYVSGVYI